MRISCVTPDLRYQKRRGAGEKSEDSRYEKKRKKDKNKKSAVNMAKRQNIDTMKKRGTHFGIFDPGRPPGALLGALLEHHPLHQLTVVDRTTELLADLRAGSVQQRHAGRKKKSGETSR